MQVRMLARVLLAALSIWPMGVAAQHAHHGASPYAGMEGRAIKSLSAEDLEELRRGGGWGLALVAELNGVPGPAHLLELAEAIPLQPDQVRAIRELHEAMQTAAMAEGERLIGLEAELDAGFREGSLDDLGLRTLLDAIGASRARLRYIHLQTHLATPELLRPEQIARYRELRGYAANDPCAAVPEGHDPKMWRRHRGCE
ncbi:MAG: hypothetical protein ACOCYE_00045 [Pseudomonadota bacterium]